MNNPEISDPFSLPEALVASEVITEARDKLATIRSYVTIEHPGFSAEQVTAEVDEMLVGAAEDRIKAEESSERIDEAVGLSVVENVDEPAATTIAMLERDGFDDEMTRVISSYAEGPQSTLDSREVAESAARLIMELEAHPVMQDGPRGIEYIAADEGKPHLERLATIDPIRVAEANRQDDEMLPRRDAGGAWREAVLGTSEVDVFSTDLAERFAQPKAVRNGQEITMGNGEVLRPIVDIGMDKATIETVSRMIEARSRGLDEAMAALNEASQSGRPMSIRDCEQLLVETGAWSRHRGAFIDTRNDGGGTIADLYADPALLERFERLDSLVEAVSGTRTNSPERLENGVINMMAFSFAGGTELIHATRSQNLAHIARDGVIAPRSRQKHGAETGRNLNGAYIHMTGPGTVAYEYTDGRGSGSVIGVPIETVVEHSPYLQLEGEYTGDDFQRDGETHSMQYEIGKITINYLAGAPAVIREALQSQHDRLAGGMRASNIGQGRYNNFTFAASGEAATAGDYEYPLDEVFVYSSDAMHIDDLVANTQYGRTLSRRTIAGAHGEPLGALPIGNSNLEGSVTLFAPISAREVAFTEASAGNRSALEVTIENVAPEAIPQYMDQLIARGDDPSVVLDAALESTSSIQGNEGAIVDAYLRQRDCYEQAGIDFGSLLNRLDTAGLRALGTSLSFGPEHKVMTQEQQQTFATIYGDKLYQDFPSQFVDAAEQLQAMGYRLAGEQSRFIADERERRRIAMEEQSKEAASMISSFGNF